MRGALRTKQWDPVSSAICAIHIVSLTTGNETDDKKEKFYE